MDSIIPQFLLYLFFIISPVIIHSKSSCSTSSCGNMFLPIKYPFKLLTDQPQKHCHDYIDLRCNDQGQAIINLPSSGDFYVTYIDYFAQKIALSDPGNCLPRRLMRNFSLYPLEALRYENYTYYMCPKKIIRHRFSEIHCLSNSTNATIATTGFSTEFMEKMYGCKPIVSSMVPGLPSTEYDDSGIFGDLELTWNVSGCKECEEYGAVESDNSSRSKWTKFFGSSLFIPSAVVLVTFFGIACLMRLMKLIASRANTNNATTNDLSADAATITTGETPAPPPPGTTNGTLGTENSKIKLNCTELDLSESQGNVTCSICLEEYQGKDRVKFLTQCGHCFHAQCIDQWLPNNTTCPVCRTTLSNF